MHKAIADKMSSLNEFILFEWFLDVPDMGGALYSLHSYGNIWELVRSTNASTLATWGAGYYITLDRYIQHLYGALTMVF